MDSLIEGKQESTDIGQRQEQAPQTPQEYTLKIKGKEIKAPWEKVQQWAQLGYDYPQKAQELNQWKSKYEEAIQKERQLQELEQKFKPYREVDEFAAQNPQWWQEIQAAYQQKMQNSSGTPPEVARIKQELLQELAPVKQFIEQQQLEKQSLKNQEEDKLLSADIESIRKSFPNIDFDSPDEEGKNLETKVLEHAMTMGLDGSKPGHFRAAFRDFYHDHLVGKAREEGKELVSKEVQKRTKLGLLGESSKPTKGLKVAENVKAKTYNDLEREALEELGIA